MIGIYNIKKDMVKRLSKSFDIYEFSIGDFDFPDIDGLIINYSSEMERKKWVYQAALIEKYIKKVKTVIFDGSLSLTQKQFKWLKKFNVYFFEPVLNNRREFQYLPYWIDDMSIDSSNERSIHMACDYYNLEDRIKYFEKYYRQFAKLFPDKRVCYSTSVLNKKKIEDYKNDNLELLDSIDYSDVCYHVIIDNTKNYKTGYLDKSIFDIMGDWCVPILSKEHRYFHALFHPLVVNDVKDIDYFTSVSGINYELIEGVFETLKKHYPEFLIYSVSDVLVNCFK